MKKPTAQPASAPASNLPCRFLRTKRMYIPALADAALDSQEDNHACYWCNKTLSALGQDDNPVHPSLCQPGRTCHET